MQDYDIQKEKAKILPLLKELASTCTGCGICLQNCAFNEYSKESSKKIMTEIKEFLLSENLDKSLSKETRKFVWECSNCEHCNNFCPLPEEIPKICYLTFLKGILVERNEIPRTKKIVHNMLAGRKGKKPKRPLLETLFSPLVRMAFPDWNKNTAPPFGINEFAHCLCHNDSTWGKKEGAVFTCSRTTSKTGMHDIKNL